MVNNFTNIDINETFQKRISAYIGDIGQDISLCLNIQFQVLREGK